MASLNHLNNIAAIYGVVEDRALVMELVEGAGQKVCCRWTKPGRLRQGSLLPWNTRTIVASFTATRSPPISIKVTPDRQ